MNGWPRDHGKRTSREPHLSLEAANQEILEHVRDTTDPSGTLMAIMAMNSPAGAGMEAQQVAAEDSPVMPRPGDSPFDEPAQR